MEFDAGAASPARPDDSSVEINFREKPAPPEEDPEGTTSGSEDLEIEEESPTPSPPPPPPKRRAAKRKEMPAKKSGAKKHVKSASKAKPPVTVQRLKAIRKQVLTAVNKIPH
jgi:hypothetical protein